MSARAMLSYAFSDGVDLNAGLGAKRRRPLRLRPGLQKGSPMVVIISKVVGELPLDIDGSSSSTLEACGNTACRHKSRLLACMNRPFLQR